LQSGSENLAQVMKTPLKSKKRLSIDDRAGVDSHLIRDSYNSVMHMLRKDPSKKSAHFPQHESEKKQYWKSLLNKRWDYL